MFQIVKQDSVSYIPRTECSLLMVQKCDTAMYGEISLSFSSQVEK